MISPQNNRLKRVFSNFNPCFKDFFSIPVLLATAFRFCFHLDTVNFLLQKLAQVVPGSTLFLRDSIFDIIFRVSPIEKWYYI